MVGWLVDEVAREGLLLVKGLNMVMLWWVVCLVSWYPRAHHNQSITTDVINQSVVKSDAGACSQHFTGFSQYPRRCSPAA
jgi:hypothetical protein